MPESTFHFGVRRVSTTVRPLAVRVFIGVRPLMHLVAFYPLLLLVVTGLLLLVSGAVLADYDVFHIVWHESPVVGITNGVLVAFTLGIVVVAVRLSDLRAAVSGGNAVPPNWAYRAAWGLLLVAFASPLAWTRWLPFDGTLPRSNGWAWWFPTGLASTAGFYFLGRAVFAKGFASTPRLGARLLLALGLGYVALVVAHAVFPETYCPYFPASVSVLLLIAFVAAFFGAVTYLAQQRRWWLYPVFLLVAVVPFACPQNQVENRLPGLTNVETGEDYYATPTRLAGIGARSAPEERAKVGLLNDADALKQWHKLMEAEFDGPQSLVLVACSGGASASAIYTADVLFTLEEACPGFSRRIRIVSGASGGMFGAAYFVSHLRPGGLIASARETPAYRDYLQEVRNSNADPAGERFQRIVAAYKAEMEKRRGPFFAGLQADFLSPVVQKWIHKDIPLSPFGFLSGSTVNDRGAALERAWSVRQNGALDVPVRGLRELERSGDLPSLVFTPMMVEDGRQLLISNLDLDYMVATGEVVDPDTDAPKLLSYMGAEFFRLFPKADGFRLSTAVRMNASFPFLSPSAALPTDPVRHVVDAGYYDNYGMVVATKWLTHDDNREFLQGEYAVGKERKKKVPEVILLRLHCFGDDQTAKMLPTEKELRAYAGRRGEGRVPAKELGQVRDRWAAEEGRAGAIRTEGGLFTLTAPLTGLFSAWRANMVYRADERLAASVERLGHPDLEGPVVRVSDYLLVCSAEPSLNWVLTKDEIDRIHKDVEESVAAPIRFANFYNRRDTYPNAGNARPSVSSPAPKPIAHGGDDNGTTNFVRGQVENQVDRKGMTATQRSSLDDKLRLGAKLSQFAPPKK